MRSAVLLMWVDKFFDSFRVGNEKARQGTPIGTRVGCVQNAMGAAQPVSKNTSKGRARRAVPARRRGRLITDT